MPIMRVGPEAIRTSDIIVPEQSPLTSFADIEQFLDNRSGLFISRLAAITRYSGRGFEDIAIDDQGIIVKSKAERSSRNLFTGKSLCIVASLAIRDGLRRKLNFQEFSVDTVSILTDFHAENWNDTVYRSSVGRHEIAAVKDMRANDTLYIDPTYPQVNHKTAGRIACIPDTLVETMYSRPSGNVRDSMRGGELDASFQLKFVSGDVEITGELYQSLVRTIAE